MLYIFLTFNVVFLETSSTLILNKDAMYSATIFIFLGKFFFPLIGDKYGESVSKTIESNPISFITSFNLEFLKVITPPIPK